MIKRIINPNVCVKIIFLELHNCIIYVANYFSRIKDFFSLGYVCFVYEFCIAETILDKLKIVLLKHRRSSGIFSYLIARFLE